VLIVVDDQDVAATQVRPRLAPVGVPGDDAEVGGKAEGGADARRAGDADLAAHELHQALADRQAEAGAAVLAGGRVVGLFEAVEQAAQLFLAQADAGIADAAFDGHAAFHLVKLAQPDQDLALLGELHGVAAEVEQDLPEAQAVSDQQPRQGRVDVEHQFQVLAGHSLAELAGDVVEDLVEVEFPLLDGELAGFDLRVVEDVVDDAQQVLSGPLRLLQVVALHPGEFGLEREMGHADDRVHRRADLVAHVGEELALGHVGGVRRLACRQQRTVRLLEGAARLVEGGDGVDQLEPALPQCLQQHAAEQRHQQEDAEVGQRGLSLRRLQGRFDRLEGQADADAAADVAFLVALLFMADQAGLGDDERRHVAQLAPLGAGQHLDPLLLAGLEGLQGMALPFVRRVGGADRLEAGDVEGGLLLLLGQFAEQARHECRVDHRQALAVGGDEVAARVVEVGVGLYDHC
jgi:hypothetical protein